MKRSRGAPAAARPGLPPACLTILKFVFLLCVICAAATGCGRDAEQSDARPRIRGGTVCTARGTPLRGAVISTEGNEPGTFLMTGEDMRLLTENGLNALHIYAEKRSDGKPVGASAENCDALIDEAERHGVTVVLTVGEFNLEADDIGEEIRFVLEFWEFYAGRYRDREHVIFEICNEMPAIDVSAEVEAAAYETIRRLAPDTMVLFYSFALTDPLDALIPHVEALEARIGDEALWGNAALAFHAYECQEDLKGADRLREVIHTLTRRGYPVVNTELPNRFELSCYPDPQLLRVCEEEGISWLSFVAWERVPVPSIWRGQLEAAGITWEPDAGGWPVTDALFPFARQSAWETAESTPVEYVSEHRFVAYRLASGDHLELRRLNFGTRSPKAFRAAVKAEGDGALALYEGGAGGALLGRCRITDTGGQYAEVDITLGAPPDGLRDVCIVYESGGGGRLHFKSWQFLLPEQRSYSNPYDGVVFAADYPFHTGDIRRAASGDAASAAPLQVEGIADGSALTFDFVEFRGEDVILRLRAMPISGGSVTVVAGDHRFQVYELGTLDISGESGVWSEYTCVLNQQEILMFDPVRQYLDLSLLFHGEGGGELFALSEFRFEGTG